jgi:hypothetical protein
LTQIIKRKLETHIRVPLLYVPVPQLQYWPIGGVAPAGAEVPTGEAA